MFSGGVFARLLSEGCSARYTTRLVLRVRRALAWFGVLMGFNFLLRSSEYLRKGAAPDEFKCARWRNATWARNHSSEDAPPGVDCDEVVLFHEYSNNDFLGQGTDITTSNVTPTKGCVFRRYSTS